MAETKNRSTEPQTVLYLHGLGGAGNGELTEWLRKKLHNYNIRVSSPSYKAHDGMAWHGLIPEANNSHLLIGVSLGGYHALQLAAHTGTPALLINPCYDPARFLKEQVGNTIPNFDEQFTQDHLDKFGLVPVVESEVSWLVGIHDDLVPAVQQNEWAMARGWSPRLLDMGHRWDFSLNLDEFVLESLQVIDHVG